MRPISIGKYRGLQRCSSSRGTITVLALDHRQNLRRVLDPKNPDSVHDITLTRFKLETTFALATEATAVLLDPQYSAPQAIAAEVITGSIGLIVALEATGYLGTANARRAQILPGWSVEKAKRMGADAVKLLVYYHPNSEVVGEVETFVEKVADDCMQHDLCLMLEPLSYSLDPAAKSLPPTEKHYVIIETARRLTPLGVDILKAEFPLDTSSGRDESLWAQACKELSAASVTPWILLSAAADYETYLRQVTIACTAGASGVAVGRAIWKESVRMTSKARLDFYKNTARQRLSRLTALCIVHARPWTEFYAAPKLVSDWYMHY